MRRPAALTLAFAFAVFACNGLLGHSDDITYVDDDSGALASSGSEGKPPPPPPPNGSTPPPPPPPGDASSEEAGGPRTPEPVITGLADPVALTVLGGAVFWTLSADSAVYSCSTTPPCNPVMTFPQGVYTSPHNLAHDGTHVFFTASDSAMYGGGFVACDPATCTMIEKGNYPDVVAHFAAGNGFGVGTVRVPANSTSTVLSFTIGGAGMVTTLATTSISASANGIALAGDRVVWVDRSVRLLQCPLTADHKSCATAPQALFFGDRAAIGAIASFGTDVLWVDGAASNTIMKCAAQGCAAPTLYANMPSAVESIATDGNDVYLGASGLWKCSGFACPSPKLVATTAGQPRIIVSDAETKSFVYWIEPAGIYRTPK